MARINEHLEYLRAKPHHVRRHYAFWSAFGITAVIFAFWISSFPAFGSVPQKAVASAVDHAGTPASSLIAAAGSVFSDLRDLIFGPSKVTYSSVHVSPGK